MTDIPAFPRPGAEETYGQQDGMSLRDWFAGQALAGLIPAQTGSPDRYARAAYVIADAMLAERGTAGARG